MDNLLGEFFGTMVLMVFGCGVCACNTLTGSKGQNGGWICITAGWGFAVTLGVFTATTLGAPQGDLNPAVTLGIFCTAPAIRNYPLNFLCEVIATFFLMFVIWMIFSNKVGAIPAGLGPYIVGVLIWALGMSLGGPTGYAMNPARDLGPRIAHAILPIAGKGSSDWAYAWVPVAAPLVGALLAYVVAAAVHVF